MITKPTLLIDEARAKANIQKMLTKAQRNNVQLRPHFKTHQSLAVGRWFKEVGINRITVSSLSMAEYFSTEWNDITVAFPVNILEIGTINELAGKVQLNLLLESVEAASFLAQHCKREVGIFIQIDVGYHRTGLAPDNDKKLAAILGIIDSSDQLQFKGILAHAGHTYDCRSKTAILERHQQALTIMSGLKDKLQHKYPHCIVSLGDTPSCSVADDFNGVDEIRPGNFVYYDLTQHQIGSNTLDEIAVAMACPIVALHPDRNEMVIYGGGVHFSKDRLVDESHGTIYGRVVAEKGKTWGDVIPTMYLKKISQEHGTVAVSAAHMKNYQIGDVIMILPVHSCMAVDLMRHQEVLVSTSLKQQKKINAFCLAKS
ncbi:MAG: alanine racemase, partial [Bacteroidota bacterium]